MDALADRRGGGSVRVRGEDDGSVLDRLTDPRARLTVRSWQELVRVRLRRTPLAALHRMQVLVLGW